MALEITAKDIRDDQKTPAKKKWLVLISETIAREVEVEAETEEAAREAADAGEWTVEDDVYSEETVHRQVEEVLYEVKN